MFGHQLLLRLGFIQRLIYMILDCSEGRAAAVS